MNDRILLLAGGEDASRSAVEWVAAHQPNASVVVAERDHAARPIGRLAHPPFRTPDPAGWETAARIAALLGGSGGAALRAAVHAVASGAVLLISGGGRFAGLIGHSAWSMNVPERPSDTLLARHADIAATAWPKLGRELGAASPAAAGPALLEALLGGDVRRVEAACRARKRAARADGPVRFRRIAARSAGLRPFAIYLDLVPSLSAGGDAARTALRDLDPGRAADLLGMSIALFI